LSFLVSVRDDGSRRWFLDREGLYCTKANLVPESITMEIRECEVVRFLHVLFCLVIMVSNS
jgi:hypothetical protein